MGRFKLTPGAGMGLVGALLAIGIVGLTAAASNKPIQVEDTGSTSQPGARDVKASGVKQVTETQAVPYIIQNQPDASLPKGQSKTLQEGHDGVKTLVYEVSYTDGVETSRHLVSETITAPAQNQIQAVGTYVAPVSCSGGYINVDGNCVPSPSNNPSGASAQCGDGTYSYSQHRSGTCSHHGGVARWL